MMLMIVKLLMTNYDAVDGALVSSSGGVPAAIVAGLFDVIVIEV